MNGGRSDRGLVVGQTYEESTFIDRVLYISSGTGSLNHQPYQSQAVDVPTWNSSRNHGYPKVKQGERPLRVKLRGECLNSPLLGSV